MSKPRVSLVSSFVSIITVLVGFSVGTAQAPIVPGNPSPGLPRKGEQKALGAGMTTTDGSAQAATPIQQQQQQSQERPSSKGLDVPPDEYFKGGGPEETSSTLLPAAQAAESAIELLE